MMDTEAVAAAIHDVHCGCEDFAAHQAEIRAQFSSDDTVYLAMARAAIAAELRHLIAELMPPAHAEDYDDREEDVREAVRSICLTFDARATELQGGASADCAATAGAPVSPVQATDRADSTVAD